MASMPLKIGRISNSLCKMQLFEKRKTFSQIFLPFLESKSNFKHFETNIMAIAHVFPKLQTVKNFDKPPCKKRRLGRRFDSQHVKVSQILEKSLWELFFHFFSSFWEKLIWKISPLLLPEILGVFLNTLTNKGKYLIEDCENLTLPIQMYLSEKPKKISDFFFHFW